MTKTRSAAENLCKMGAETVTYFRSLHNAEEYRSEELRGWGTEGLRDWGADDEGAVAEDQGEQLIHGNLDVAIHPAHW